MLIDTHAHLQDNFFKDNVDQVIQNAHQNNVNKIVCASYNLQSSYNAVEISNKYNGVYAVVGFHPENCEEFDSNSLAMLEELCKNSKVVAVGEIGLDYHYTTENIDVQKQVFVEQILLADKLNLPIVIHTRDAIGDTMDIIRKYKKNINNGGVFHCFNASKEILDEITKMGFYVSFGGAITFKNAPKLRELVKHTPLDKLLTETDCPYMAPVPLRGQLNEPKNIGYILEKMCEIKNIEKNKLEEIIENNVKNIFKI